MAIVSSTADSSKLAPGVTITCRDEVWLITQVTQVSDGWRLRVRGLSDFVRDTTATFFTALEPSLSVLDPTKVTVEPDTSPRFRQTSLWVESILRSTPVPLYQESLEVADRLLLDPLEYQLDAVRKALNPSRTRPRILLADAVGLGKTLEIGMILAELVRRGRGERILVVTPRHVLEQFQQELWTRCAIPLVRLDSQGIQNVRQKLPASKNPFTYFPRVIVSMDTLKSPKYRAQLEKVRWDAVVIDEIHNATNAGSHNNALARTLAPRTESLIVASATPHNGNPESFKEILRLLDPLSVRPDGSIDREAAQNLIIRRHRHSPEVASKVGDMWAERLEPRNIGVPASAEEKAVARELREAWIKPASASGNARSSSRKGADHLFPWTLFKAFLSSPAALEHTITERLRKAGAEESVKLRRLQELNSQVTAARSAKFQELVRYVRGIGVKKGGETRVVVFSERVDTLGWLQENLEAALKLPRGAVKIMHGGLSDVEQMALIDEFKRENTKLRVLVTGDVASEGVNLHAQCHHLVHYDIPWSLIRIQQRNGRIDRYGQRHSPQITTLILDTGEELSGTSEIHVLSRLIDREHAAQEMLGDVSSLMGVHSVAAEENSIRDVLAGARAFDDVVASPEDVLHEAEAAAGSPQDAGITDLDALMAMVGLSGSGAPAAPAASANTAPAAPTPTPSRRAARSLYTHEVDYLTAALDEAFLNVKQDRPEAGGVSFRSEGNGIVEFVPPADLQHRFDVLPRDYVEYREVRQKVVLATTKAMGAAQLEAARSGDSEKTWPNAHYLGPLHPVTEWAVDRALSHLSHDTIPAFVGEVDAPTVLLMGTLTNDRGQVVTRSFHVVRPGPLGLDVPVGVSGVETTTIEDPCEWLRAAGLGTTAISTGRIDLPAECPELLRQAVQQVSQDVEMIRISAAQYAQERTQRWSDRAAEWEAAAQGQMNSRTMLRGKEMIAQEKEILRSSMPARSMVRPVVLVLSRDSHEGKEL